MKTKAESPKGTDNAILFPRIIMPDLRESLKLFPVTLLTGARQTGKSTLALELLDNYLTFDDINVYDSSKTDPASFVKNLDKPIVLDEIQKVPELMNTIKLDVDSNKTKGGYFLTGSSNIISFKNIADTLAGRIGIFNLFPLTSKEISFKNENIIDILFGNIDDNLKIPKIDNDSILLRVVKGGYPDVQGINSEKGRYIWFSSYLSAYIERDIRGIGELRRIDKFIKMLNIIASRSANILNKSDLAKDSGIENRTLDNYISLLEKVYQVHLLQPYSANINKRFIKMPKIFMTDSGMLSHMLGVHSLKDIINSPYKGTILETFVFSELFKNVKYLNTPAEIYFYRTHDKEEIDFIIEKAGEIIAVEVKMSQTIQGKDFKNIGRLMESGNNLKTGLVLYMGDKLLTFGKNMRAVPMSVLF